MQRIPTCVHQAILWNDWYVKTSWSKGSSLSWLIRNVFHSEEMSPFSHVTPDDKIKSGSIGVLVPNSKLKVSE